MVTLTQRQLLANEWLGGQLSLGVEMESPLVVPRNT